MASLLSNPTHQAQLGYNGFDMSMRNKFSSTTGELLPVYYDILQPGDKIRAFCDINSRTQPIASAAMCSIDEIVDWFFVPMEQLYHFFGSLFYGVNDNHTSLADISNLVPTLPTYQASQMAAICADLSSVQYQVDNFGYWTQYRLLHMFNYPFLASLAEQTASMGITPYLLCAYQKIYNDFYRIEDRENPDVVSFSMDKFYNVSATPISDSDFWGHICQLRYAPKRKDFFTNTFVSPLFTTGGISAAPTTHNLANDFNQWLIDGLNVAPVNHSAQVNPIDTASAVMPGSISSLGVMQKVVSPTNIRTMFASQKLLEITRRAGKTYDMQTLAHFGIKPNNYYHDTVKVLGKQSKQIVIGEVIATAAGSSSGGSQVVTSSVLGQVGGRGYSGRSNSGNVEFTADCHGILMAIYHAEVSQDYNANYYFDRLNTYATPADWFHPEFDNLGMQPLFRYQSNYDPTTAANNSLFYSWQYRWTELKCKYNQVHGSLSGTLDYWTPNVDNLSFNALKEFQVSPHQLDKIMLAPYLGADYADVLSDGVICFDTDPLLHDFNFNVVKSSKMNVYSLEQL